jgi:hypothetical protein
MTLANFQRDWVYVGFDLFALFAFFSSHTLGAESGGSAALSGWHQ